MYIYIYIYIYIIHNIHSPQAAAVPLAEKMGGDATNMNG